MGKVEAVIDVSGAIELAEAKLAASLPRRWRHVRWRVVRAMLLAWLVTVPATGVLAVVALVPWRWIT